MDQKFSDYFTSIGMGPVLIEKMSNIYDQFKYIYNDSLEDVVVSEYVTGDGQRQYSGAFFFSKYFIYEVENLMSESPKMWIAKLDKNIGSIGLIPKDYDFKNAKSASRLNLDCMWNSGTNFMLDIKTSGDNCSHLINIVNKYLKPNLD